MVPGRDYRARFRNRGRKTNQAPTGGLSNALNTQLADQLAAAKRENTMLRETLTGRPDPTTVGQRMRADCRLVDEVPR